MNLLRALTDLLDRYRITHRVPPEGWDLELVCSRGTFLVSFQSEGEKPLLRGDFIFYPRASTNSPQEVLTNLLALIGEQLSPVPERGLMPVHKLRCENNFDEVAFRHREFRRSRDPSPQEIQQYQVVINRACKHIWYRNMDLLMREMFDQDDLKTYALVWTTNYLSQYLRPPEQDLNADNQKLLYNHLCQRFVELIDLLNRRSKASLPDYDSVCVTFWSRPASRDEPQLPEPCEEADESPVVTKRAAADELASKLASLPHDTMVSKLLEIEQNDHLAPDLCREARRWLAKHRKTCPNCSK